MKGKAILFLAAIGVVFSSCTRANEENIIGYWTETEITCTNEGKEICSSIVFYSDGRAEFSNFDFDLYSANDEKLNFVGLWSIELSEDPLDNNSILIHIGPNETFPNGFKFSLYMLFNSNEKIIHGLPDDAHKTFVKSISIEP